MVYHILIETDTIHKDQAAYNSSSILISILYLIGLIHWSCNSIKQQTVVIVEVDLMYTHP